MILPYLHNDYLLQKTLSKTAKLLNSRAKLEKRRLTFFFTNSSAGILYFKPAIHKPYPNSLHPQTYFWQHILKDFTQFKAVLHAAF
ncbi:hypothetical protein [Listeria sp. PSOL-1]|uniref:hypothetical protein n=1 Tax=Listeria sp. PSOL-1 TaxID=1844999 RepID=UPI0013D795C2|nr:hypothetical protein [Listeria sp. PSOL-1]